ncbi:hypothetical protein [Pseudomonas sp. EA_65y_Pfl1_P113]|uniref:hypothetical protein n=1 Tax=Pseudomonas sp. EA_65y_Pfl1_P113 TaxID=3088692 RepID=UPI0030DCFB1B
MNAHTLAAALPTAADQPTDAAAIHAAALLLLPHIERGERIGDGAPIDDRTALREGFKAWRHAFQIGGRAIRVHAGCA